MSLVLAPAMADCRSTAATAAIDDDAVTPVIVALVPQEVISPVRGTDGRHHVFTSDGYPYVIDSFDLAGTTDVGALALASQGKAGFPRRDQLDPIARTNELALGFTIDDFPTGP